MSGFLAEVKSPYNASGSLDMTEQDTLAPSSDVTPSLPFEDNFHNLNISSIDYSDPSACPDVPFFMGGDRRSVLDELEHLCQFSHSLVAVLGDPGVGKTALAYQAAVELSGAAECCVMEASAFNSTENMLLILAQQLGIFIPEGSDIDVMVVAINQYQPVGSGQDVVVIVDAAHHLHYSALEVFVQLLQKPMPNYFHVLLVGDHTLQIQLDKLDKQSVLVYDIPLRSFNEDEVGHYIAFKLAQADYQGAELFNPDSVRQLWQKTNGVAAQINEDARKILLLENGMDHEERHLGLPIGYMAVVVLLLAALILAIFYIDDTSVSAVEPSDPSLIIQGNASKPSKSISNEQSLSGNVLQTEDNLSEQDVSLAEAVETKQEAVTQDASNTPVESDSDFLVVDAPSLEKSSLVDSSEGETPEIVVEVVADTVNKAETKTEAKAEVKTEDLIVPVNNSPKKQVQEKAKVEVKESVSPPPVSPPSYVQATDGELAIMSWPADNYTLQVMAAGQLSSINEFVKSQSNRDLLRVITLRRNGALWYVVFSGVYESREEARLAISSLPELQKNTRPWPRQILEIQQKISDFRRK
jgi:DamX protein